MIPGLIKRITRALTISLFVFGSVTSIHGVSRAAEDDPESTVAGRLGGVLQSFNDRFGDPVSINEAAGPIFAVDGYGYFGVQVDHVQGGHDLGSRVTIVTVSAPRPPDRPAKEPDPADWTIAGATARVRSLLPTDAELTDFAAATSGQLEATCQSRALEEIFATSTPGQCRVTLLLPTAETVSYATLTMAVDTVDATAATPTDDACTGALEWIQTAGNQLTQTQTLLGKIAAVNEADPDAPAALRELADSFRELAADHRESTPPKAAAQANYYLVSALTAYAKAIETAADGLEKGDGDLIDNAVAAFDGAGKLVAQATNEIEQAGTACDLELGTPVPASSPVADSRSESVRA